MALSDPLRCATARRDPRPKPEPKHLPEPSWETRALSEDFTLGASAALNPKSGGVWVVRGGYCASRARATRGVLGRGILLGVSAPTPSARISRETLKPQTLNPKTPNPKPLNPKKL